MLNITLRIALIVVMMQFGLFSVMVYLHTYTVTLTSWTQVHINLNKENIKNKRIKERKPRQTE